MTTDRHTIREEVQAEALRAKAAAPQLRDDLVATALQRAADRLRKERAQVRRANDEDLVAAAGALDDGALDRLRLTQPRLEQLERQLRQVADLPGLPRRGDSWKLDNGLSVSEWRVPIGAVGANFEARPAVALDIASQLLKSLNSCVLRTGAAALATVRVLVEVVLQPALEEVGLPPESVGLVRTGSHEGADALVALPDELPLVILRGSGASTERLAKLAAANGVQTLAHAAGGGVLYIDVAADLEKARDVIRFSLDRLGVCNRLNLLLVHEELSASLERFGQILNGLGIAVYGTERARRFAPLLPLSVKLGHEWANDPHRVASVTCDVVAGPVEAAQLANEATSGLAASIVSEDDAAADCFLGAYRGTTALWNAPTRFADGFALTGTPETGINVGRGPGPRGPVTFHDLWLRQYRVVGDGSQHR